MEDLFDWQDYENCAIPENVDKKGVYLLLSKKKPKKEDNGFWMTIAFQYTKSDNGEKLWIKFKREGEE